MGAVLAAVELQAASCMQADRFETALVTVQKVTFPGPNLIAKWKKAHMTFHSLASPARRHGIEAVPGAVRVGTRTMGLDRQWVQKSGPN